MLNQIRLWVLIVITLWVSSSQTDALEILSDNLLQPDDNVTLVDNQKWTAQGFSTSTVAFDIREITLPLSRVGSTTGNFEVAIFDNLGANGRPGAIVGAVLGSFDAAATLSTTETLFTISNINRILQPQTNYCLVVRGASLTDDVYWRFTSSNTGQGFPSNYSESANSGSIWSLPDTSSPQKMYIAALPEPSSIFLGLISIAVLSGVARRTHSIKA